MKTGSAAWAIAVMVTVSLAACSGDDDSSRPRIVVSTNILGDIVSNVVKDEAHVEVLVPVGSDPHDYQLSAAEAASMQTADLVIVNGLGLEEGMIDVVESLIEDGANVLPIGPRVDPLAFADSLCDPALTARGCDPHFWMDPVRMIEAVRVMEQALSDMDPSIDWSITADLYVSELAALNEQVENLLSEVAPVDRKLVTNHDSLEYLARRYGFEVVGVVIPGGSTLSDPSSAELAELVAVMKKEMTESIFADTSSSDSLADAVAVEVGIDVHVVDLFTGSLGAPGTDSGTYLGMMRTNASLIVEALG